MWKRQTDDSSGRHAIAMEASFEYGLIQLNRSHILHNPNGRYESSIMELLQANLLDDLRRSSAPLVELDCACLPLRL